MVYFLYLPLKLNDSPVIKKYLGERTIKGKSYHQIEVSFDGGEKIPLAEIESLIPSIQVVGLTKNLKSRYLKLYIKNHGTIAEGKQGAGHKAWLFIDEIIIN